MTLSDDCRKWSAEMHRAAEVLTEAGAGIEVIDGNRAIADTLAKAGAELERRDRRHWYGKPASSYVALIPLLVFGAREVGYALAVHGSLSYDLDLIAVPWTDEAVDPLALIDHLCGAIGLPDSFRATITGPVDKPHERLAWIIPMGNGLHIDLSVMPRDDAIPWGQGADGGAP